MLMNWRNDDYESEHSRSNSGGEPQVTDLVLTAQEPPVILQPLVGRPLCIFFTGIKSSDLRGDYSQGCNAGVSYDRFPRDVRRWPCRFRGLLDVEQCQCSRKQFKTDDSSPNEKALQLAERKEI
jgi:hypothetical protein